ncbi:MAG: PP0621 family protein [Acidobacteriota bacterium]
MLLRFLAIALVVYLGWRGLRQLLAPSAPDRGPSTTVQEVLVPCDRCEVLVPESRVLRDGSASFCSPDCQRASSE